jgi:hypothetical protein
VARGLRLEGGYRDALAHQLVHQRRFSYVRIAHNVYKACFVFHQSFVHFGAKIIIFSQYSKCFAKKERFCKRRTFTLAAKTPLIIC